MVLTFFSHNLILRKVNLTGHYIYAAGGRLSKILSAFSYLKISEGKVDWLRAASRVCGLMVNLWPYKFEFEAVYPYLYHMIHHFFLLDGQNLSSEWSGVFRSIPSDEMMLCLRNGHAFEGSSFFSNSTLSSSHGKTRVLQSALKSALQTPPHFDTKPMSTNQQPKNVQKKKGKRPNKSVGSVAAAAAKAAATVATNVINSSHAPSNSKQPKANSAPSGSSGISDLISKGIGAVGKFLRDEGLETLVTLGASILARPDVLEVKRRRNVLRASRGLTPEADTLIPAGTILSSVALYPNFAADVEGPDSTSRLKKKSETFLKYRFRKSVVKFTPAAGALNNGQIGFFIASDPRYLLTATGQDAVRLVHEFKGAVTQVSQPATLPVPEIKDMLFIEDAHESDVRFTQQGVLWVIAFTDVSIGSDPSTGTSTSLGEFSLDYHVEFKDDSLDGALVKPSGGISSICSYYNDTNTGVTGTADGVGLFADPDLVTPFVDSPCATSTLAISGLGDVMFTKSTIATPFLTAAAPWNSAGMFTCALAGVYTVSFDAMCRITYTAAAVAGVEQVITTVVINGSNQIQIPCVMTNDTNFLYFRAYGTFSYSLSIGDTFYLYSVIGLAGQYNDYFNFYSSLNIQLVNLTTPNPTASYSLGLRRLNPATQNRKKLDRVVPLTLSKPSPLQIGARRN